MGIWLLVRLGAHGELSTSKAARITAGPVRSAHTQLRLMRLRKRSLVKMFVGVCCRLAALESLWAPEMIRVILTRTTSRLL